MTARTTRGALARRAVALLIALLLRPVAAHAGGAAGTGTLAITVVDARTGRPTPARVEVADAAGGLHVPADAVPAPGRCPDGSDPAWYPQLAAGSPMPRTMRIDMQVQDPAVPGSHFYALGGAATLDLAPGSYQVTGFKGLEHLRRSDAVEVLAGETTQVTLALERFVNMPLRGWFSADAHVHIARHDSVVNPLLADWMEAEDVHVATLLEMGTYVGTEASPQYAFGAPGLYRRGRTILAPGQENPRSWTLGHGIVLGATSYIDFRDRYLDYRAVWAEAARQGARSGYAHWGGPAWPLDLTTGELDFLEVLQFGIGDYEDLYLAWDLGYRIAPTAGTDYQCVLSGPPGLVRFYTRVAPPLTWEKWLAALDAGRTFVTNGPFVTLTVDGTDVGGRVQLAAPGTVHVTASLRFDPTRDEIEALEIVRNGEVVHRVPASEASGGAHFAGPIAVDEPAWIAARVRGWKIGAAAVQGGRAVSIAHTGSIVVGITGMPAPRTARRRDAARRARERIDALEEHLDDLRRRKSISALFNQFDAATLRRDWPLLEEALGAGRRHYQAIEAR